MSIIIVIVGAWLGFSAWFAVQIGKTVRLRETNGRDTRR